MPVYHAVTELYFHILVKVKTTPVNNCSVSNGLHFREKGTAICPNCLQTYSASEHTVHALTTKVLQDLTKTQRKERIQITKRKKPKKHRRI